MREWVVEFRFDMSLIPTQLIHEEGINAIHTESENTSRSIDAGVTTPPVIGDRRFEQYLHPSPAGYHLYHSYWLQESIPEDRSQSNTP